MEITFTLREAEREETLCLDDELRMDEVLRRIAAQGSFTARAADCLYLRSKNGGGSSLYGAELSRGRHCER